MQQGPPEEGVYKPDGHRGWDARCLSSLRTSALRYQRRKLSRGLDWNAVSIVRRSQCQSPGGPCRNGDRMLPNVSCSPKLITGNRNEKKSSSGAFVVHEEIVHCERSEKEGWRTLYSDAMAARGLTMTESDEI